MRPMITRRNLRRTVFILIVVILILGLFVAPVSTRPVKAACTWGDIICDMQQALEQLIDTYVTPLKAWAQLQAYRAVYGLAYSASQTVAGFMWSISRMLTTVGVGIGVLSGWIADNFFVPLIKVTTDIMRPAVGIFLFAALVILGISYFLAAIIRLNVVSLRSVVLWWIAGALFFSLGPSVYRSMRTLTQSLNSFFYAASLTALKGQSPFSSLAEGDPAARSAVYRMPTPCTDFSAYLTGSGGRINGLDVALAFQWADGFDIVNGGNPCLGGGLPADLPRRWFSENGFFDASHAPDSWPGFVTCPPAPDPCDYDKLVGEAVTKMQAALSQSFGGVAREWQAMPLVWFAIAEQLVMLCLVIAQGLTFISFACAMVFAFFKRTEPVAWAVIDQWLSLLVQSIIIALIQGLTVALYLAAATTGSPLVTMAVSIVALVMLLILLVSGVRAIWNAFNKLFEAFGQASGGVIMAPGQATVAVAGMGAAVVTGGMSVAGSAMGGLDALSSGATVSQAAGIVFGGSHALEGASYHLARLPGLSDTSLGSAASEFSEGATARRAASGALDAVPGFGGTLSRLGGATLGSALLTDRDPDNAEAWVDPKGQVGWRAPLLNKRVDSLLENATGDANGFTLREADGTPVTRGGNISLNNDGDLDETINADFRRTLAADKSNHATEGATNNSGVGESLIQAANALRAGADALRSSAERNPMTISGVEPVATVMGRVIDNLSRENATEGTTGASQARVGKGLAGAIGLDDEPGEDHPIRGRMARYQLFADQALRMGVSGDDAADVLREVKSAPDQMMSTSTRDRLIHDQRENHGQSWADSIQQVRTLEHTARMVPTVIVAERPQPQSMKLQADPKTATPVDPTENTEQS